jgi:hypothetical protein
VTRRQLPADLVVFLASSRKYGHEPAAMPVDIRHILHRRQLAVRHVQKIGPSRQLAEQVPGFTMRLIIEYIAATSPKLHRDTAIPRERENVKQLLQVGPMVFVVAERDRRGQTAVAQPLSIGAHVGTMEGDGRGIVV